MIPSIEESTRPMNGKPSFDISTSGNNFDKRSLDFGPATAIPDHCSVVDKTFTSKSGHTTCK